MLPSDDDHPEALIKHLSLDALLAFLVARDAVRGIPSSTPPDPLPPPSCGFGPSTIRDATLTCWIEPDPFPSDQAPAVKP